jgi:hypothetical protein
LAYVHLIEPRTAGVNDQETSDSLAPFHKVFKGTLIAAGGYNRTLGMQAIADGESATSRTPAASQPTAVLLPAATHTHTAYCRVC